MNTTTNNTMTKEHRDFMKTIRPLISGHHSITENAIVETTQGRFYSSLSHLVSELFKEVNGSEKLKERIKQVNISRQESNLPPLEEKEYKGGQNFIAQRFKEQLENDDHTLWTKATTVCGGNFLFYRALDATLIDRKYYYVKNLSVDQLKEIVQNTYPNFTFEKQYEDEEIRDAACCFVEHNENVGRDIFVTARVDKQHDELLKSGITMIGHYTRDCDPLCEITIPDNFKYYASISALIRETFEMVNIPKLTPQQINNLIPLFKKRIATGEEICLRVRKDSWVQLDKINEILRGRKFVFFDSLDVKEIEANEKNRVDTLAAKKLEAYENIFTQFLPLVTQMSEVLANMSKQLEELKK